MNIPDRELATTEVRLIEALSFPQTPQSDVVMLLGSIRFARVRRQLKVRVDDISNVFEIERLTLLSILTCDDSKLPVLTAKRNGLCIAI